ncbi:hypothetical protein ABB37_07203 [Leptomonas pyrrhocoris]|uniref:Uncharacterized protein n=1 Tax=Leptomonas pyrrhocoris TaxID=157538 RepID=A0A0M9FWH2_LEPPY|nr:hypothetical protein ABB37_07203 [Leptomonas pyrrhocoris]KPA77316.1 hypothetical protein ABB37_07203 [Leptomonas pyrrhocoris]|eukprot:XP_015655755.1 hypothetical protein ABB37_07203 [Leptomonas pyrrhocoris]
MDLAEKRKQLEAVRAARQAKQHVVDQYMTGRSPGGSSTSLASASYASTIPTMPPPTTSAGAAAQLPVPSARPSSSSPASPPSPSSPSAGHAAAGATVKKRDRLTAETTASSPRTPPSATAAPDDNGKTTRTRAGAAPTPSPPPAHAPQRPSSASSASAATPTSPLHTKRIPGATAPLIQVMAVDSPRGSLGSRRQPSPTSKAPPGNINAPSAAAPREPPTTTTTAPTTDKRASPGSGGGADARARTAKKPAVHVDVHPDGRSGWSALQHCMRGGGAAHDPSAETSTYPVCVFNPAAVLGDATGPSDSIRRRVILDAMACLVPYEGAAGLLGDSGESASDSTIWSVCVAATYGAKNPLYTEVANSGDYPAASSAVRRGSAEGGAVTSAGTDAHSGRGGGGGSVNYINRTAESALEWVRASMECGFPWGSASAAQTAVPGTTMDAALHVARESPGLVLAWFMVPLPANTLPRSAGTLYAESPTSAFAPPPRSAGASAAAAQADYVVVVVPLVCDSEVTTLLAHPFQPSTLLGGTRCGRVVQWSLGSAWAQVEPRRLVERALATTGTATTLLLPPQRPTHSSFPSPQAHQAPVLRMAIHGDLSCHHLYSISQEGKVCTWTAWQPLHPTASCLSYLGIRPMGNIGVTARFVERPGTDAMTQVFIGTTSGALLIGANRDAKSIELQYYGPPRPVPTSSTVIKTLDVTAIQPAAAPATPTPAATLSNAPNFTTAPGEGGGVVVSPSGKGPSAESWAGLGARDPTAAPAGDHTVGESPGGSMGGATGSRRPPSSPSSALLRQPSQRSPTLPSPLPPQPQRLSPSLLPPPPPPQPHHGRIVSMTLQTATQGFRGQDCVVSAATDGSCVAWFQRSAIPLEGFSSAVTSVCWSPTKPGVLAAGDSGGMVTVWAVNVSIITPVATVSLREASRRTRGSATSDAVLWVVVGPSDAIGRSAGAAGFFGEATAEEDEEDEDVGDADASFGQVDAVGAAISSLFFSRDGRWLFASTACGYVYSMRLSALLA